MSPLAGPVEPRLRLRPEAFAFGRSAGENSSITAFGNQGGSSGSGKPPWACGNGGQPSRLPVPPALIASAASSAATANA